MAISEPPWYIALLIDPVVFDIDTTDPKILQLAMSAAGVFTSS